MSIRLGETPSVVPGIFELIADADDYTNLLGMDPGWEQHALTADQATSIERAVNAGENSQQAIYVGFRSLARLMQAGGEPENKQFELDYSCCNDLSWIMSHLTDELEAISTTINSLNHRCQLAYKYSAGKK